MAQSFIKYFFLILLLIPSLSFAQTKVDKENAVSTQTLCSPDEKIIFSCKTESKGRLLSLCASKDLTKTSGMLQYRFGTANKIDLVYPKDPKTAQTTMFYGHYFRSQVDRSRVSFNNNEAAYEIFNSYDEESQPQINEAGVRVNDKFSILCRSKPINNMADLESVLGCEQDAYDCP